MNVSPLKSREVFESELRKKNTSSLQNVARNVLEPEPQRQISKKENNHDQPYESPTTKIKQEPKRSETSPKKSQVAKAEEVPAEPARPDNPPPSASISQPKRVSPEQKALLVSLKKKQNEVMLEELAREKKREQDRVKILAQCTDAIEKEQMVVLFANEKETAARRLRELVRLHKTEIDTIMEME